MAAAVADRVRELRWYHSLELGPGLVTQGMFDMRPYVGQYGLPEDLSGKRVLEIGTWDGFWAFELEKRGAEVVALDLDDERRLDVPPRRKETFSDRPRGDGFRLAKEILGSKAERVDMSVYDATPEELGTFDLVFCGSVIMHLRDQLLALQRIASVCAGTFITANEYDRFAGLVPFPVARYHADRDASVVFWMPAAKTWKRLMWTAGFDEVKEHGRFTMKSNEEFSVRHVVHHASRSAFAGQKPVQLRD